MEWTSKKLSATVLIFLVVQSATIVWWAATVSAQTKQNTEDILDIKNSLVIPLTRDQLDDILGSRDVRIANIEQSVNRIEAKLDRLNK